MSSSYPGGLDALNTSLANATAQTTTHPNHHNDLADAVNKIEAELGTDPAGVYATVKARLAGGIPYINVRDYGAAGDGVADDTTEIQAALTAAAASHGGTTLGSTVFLPAGEYKITAQITIPYNVQMIGEGRGEFLSAYGATTIKSTFNGVSVLVQENRYGWSIRDLSITGDTSLGSQDLLKIGEGNNALPTQAGVLERLYISQAGRDCLVVDDALHVHAIDVYCHKAERYNLRIEGQSNNTKFTKCQFREAKQWGVYWRGGIGVLDTCTIESNSRHATLTYGGLWMDASDPDAGAQCELTTVGVHFENNKGVTGLGQAIKTTASSGKPARLTELQPAHFEEKANLLSELTYYTGVGGSFNNLVAQFTVTSTGPCVWLNPTGTPTFAVTNTSGTARIIDASGVRSPVRAASTANVTLTAPGATIDGVTMAASDRMLLKDQTAASANGIYIWNGAASTATRALDADTAAKLTDTLQVTVDEGTFNADTIWTLQTNKPITLGSTALRFMRLAPGYNFASRDPWSHAGNAIAATMDRNDVTNLITQTVITAITSFHGGMVVPAGRLITNINAFCTAAGSGSVTTFWWALVRQSDRVVLQRTANSTSLPTVDAVHTRALQATITLDYDTPCYIALGTQVATTSPSFAGVTGLATSNFSSPILTGNSSTAPTSTPPTVGAVLGAPAAGNTGRIHAWLS